MVSCLSNAGHGATTTGRSSKAPSLFAHSFGHLCIQILNDLADDLGTGVKPGLFFLTEWQRETRQGPLATNQMW
jgi:hypothetical protein